jgi:hypothetical protein
MKLHVLGEKYLKLSEQHVNEMRRDMKKQKNLKDEDKVGINWDFLFCLLGKILFRLHQNEHEANLR